MLLQVLSDMFQVMAGCWHVAGMWLAGVTTYMTGGSGVGPGLRLRTS